MRKLVFMLTVVLLMSSLAEAASRVTYNHASDTYEIGGVTFSRNLQTSQYVSPQTTRDGSPYYEVYDPRKQQAVTFVSNQPKEFYTFNPDGTYANSIPISSSSPQYLQFTGQQPTAAQPGPAGATGTGGTAGAGQTGAPTALPPGFSVVVGTTAQPGAPGATAGAQPGQPAYYVYQNQVVVRAPGTAEKPAANPPAGAIEIPQTLANSIQKTGQEIESVTPVTTGGVLTINMKPKDIYADNLFEDYKTTTTVSMTYDPSTGAYTKSVDEQTSICGSSLSKCELNEDGSRKFVPLTGSRITESETRASISTTKDGKPVKGDVLTKETKTVYDKNDKIAATMTVGYGQKEKERPLGPREVNQIEVLGADGKTPIYKLTLKPDGTTSVDVNKLKEVEPREDREKIAGKIVSTGRLGWADAWYALSWQQSLDRWVQGYYEYQGLRQLSGLFWPGHSAEVQAAQEKIKQQFCIAAGISNCLTSVICGSIYDLEADNVISGRGPGGQFVSSAVVNAERTPAIEVAGMTRQQLIDMFGNTTVISGRLFNLTDPAFDPKVLGRIKIRLYHVQYSLRNNGVCEGGVSWGGKCEQRDMTYNLLFVRVPQELNTSYGKPVGQAYWFTGAKLPTIKHLESAKDDIYKFSATEYSDVCLTFNPGLPSGSAMSSDIVDKLCVPFKESLAPAPISQQPGGGAAPAPALGGGAPGGTI